MGLFEVALCADPGLWPAPFRTPHPPSWRLAPISIKMWPAWMLRSLSRRYWTLISPATTSRRAVLLRRLKRSGPTKRNSHALCWMCWPMRTRPCMASPRRTLSRTGPLDFVVLLSSGGNPRLFATDHNQIESLAISRDGKLLSVGDSSGQVSLWELQ